MRTSIIRPRRSAARHSAATPPPFICRAAALVLAALAAIAARAEDPATNAAPRVVACVGDSITWGGGGTNSYPSILGRELGEGWKVLNFGVNSRTARRDGKEFDLRPGDLDYRKTLNYTKSLSCKPDAVILMIGTNDSKPPNWEETGEAFREGYADLVDDYLALDPRPVVVIGISPTVKGGGFTYGVTEKIVGEGVVPVQRKIAEEKGLPTVDCRAILDPHMATAYSPDGLHPNAEGNALLAAAFAAKLRELFPEDSAKSVEDTGKPENGNGSPLDGTWRLNGSNLVCRIRNASRTPLFVPVWARTGVWICHFRVEYSLDPEDFPDMPDAKTLLGGPERPICSESSPIVGISPHSSDVLFRLLPPDDGTDSSVNIGGNVDFVERTFPLGPGALASARRALQPSSDIVFDVTVGTWLLGWKSPESDGRQDVLWTIEKVRLRPLAEDGKPLASLASSN